MPIDNDTTERLILPTFNAIAWLATVTPGMTAPEAWSQLQRDDVLCGPFPISTLTRGLILRGAGLLESWRLGLKAEVEHPTGAPRDVESWAVSIRDAIDLGSTATWMLGPISQGQRVCHRLELEAHYARELRRAQRSAGLSTSTANAAARLVREAAADAGVRADGRSTHAEILAAAAQYSAAGDALEAVRQLLDLTAHGSIDALDTLASIPLSLPGEPEEEPFTAPPGSGLAVALAAATSVLDCAYQLYQHRRATRDDDEDEWAVLAEADGDGEISA